LLFIKVNKTTIVVISAHALFISAMPFLLLACGFTCYGPSAFYLAVRFWKSSRVLCGAKVNS
jgi:hypothetical protein